MNSAELNQISMTMIANAGTAKNLIQNVLLEMERTEVDIDQIKQQLGEANQVLIKAHQAQNKAIKNSETLTYSLLFTHAQDTLMNTEESLFLVKHFIKIIQSKL